MKLELRTGLPGDPFWDVVRRRVPTAVPVLLPPAAADPPEPPPDRPPEPPVADDDVLAARDETTVLLRSLWAAALGGAGATETPAASLRPGPGRATLVAAASLTARGAADGAAMFARLDDALDGWERRRHEGDVVHVLDAAYAGRRVRASYRPDRGTIVVTVTSVPLPVTREQSRRLRAGAS